MYNTVHDYRHPDERLLVCSITCVTFISTFSWCWMSRTHASSSYGTFLIVNKSLHRLAVVAGPRVRRNWQLDCTPSVDEYRQGPFINSVTRDRPLFRPRFTPPTPLRHATFKPFSVYFEPAPHSIFDLTLPPPHHHP